MTINLIWLRAVSLAVAMTVIFVSSSAGSTVMLCPSRDGLVLSGDKLGVLNSGGKITYLHGLKKVLPLGRDFVLMTVGHSLLNHSRWRADHSVEHVADFDTYQTFNGIMKTNANMADDLAVAKQLDYAFEAFINKVPVGERSMYMDAPNGIIFSSILVRRGRLPGDYKFCLYQGILDPVKKSPRIDFRTLGPNLKISKIGLLGEDPVTESIEKRVKPYDLVGKQKWCQDFYLHPKPVSTVTKGDATCAIVEYMALIHRASPKRVGDTLDFWLFSPTSIEKLGENLTFNQARAKFKRPVARKIQR